VAVMSGQFIQTASRGLMSYSETSLRSSQDPMKLTGTATERLISTLLGSKFSRRKLRDLPDSSVLGNETSS